MTRPRVVVAAVALAALFSLTGCGGGDVGRVKGRLTDNGQPVTFAPNAQAAVVFQMIGPDGQPDVTKTYSMMLAPDGSFELLASAGELPPGTYQVKLDIAGKDAAKFKKFSTKREVKPGENVIELDLAKPN